MVLRTVRRTSALPAVVVPDERSWAMWGRDLAATGFVPAAGPEEAAVVLVPAEVPEPLADALVDVLRRVPGTPRALALASPLRGVPASELLSRAARPDTGDDGDDEDEDAHGHEHGDEHMHGDDDGDADEPWANNMMPIHGTPSSDGLVMDDVEVVLGPLGSPLPGGLVAELGLDGEVVCRCRLTRMLEAQDDPQAPAAWRAAFDQATEAADGRPPSEATTRRRIAAVEAERALSHVTSVREIGRVLGWQELVDAATHAVDACSAARAAAEALPPAVRAADDLGRLLDGSRRLRARTRGRSRLAAHDLKGIPGPVARAAGVPVDARLGDGLYAALGFALTTLDGGDAEARVLLRLTEARVALRLATAALAERGEDGQAGGGPPSGAVEGPRGPVRASMSEAGWRAAAPGADRLVDVARGAVIGETYSAAVVALVSFDLSAWDVAA